MDKQHSDHIENRIRQAAEGITTPVTEEAWQKMEALLDKKEKKKRRRGIFWWWYVPLIALMTGSGLWYFSGKQSEVSTKQQESVTSTGIKKNENEAQLTRPAPGGDNKLPPTAPGIAPASPGNTSDPADAAETGTKTNASVQQPALVAKERSKPGRTNSGTGDVQYRQEGGSLKKAKKSANRKAGGTNGNEGSLEIANTQNSTSNATVRKNPVATNPTLPGKSQDPELKTLSSDSTVAKNPESGTKEQPATDTMVTKKAGKKLSKQSIQVNKPGFYLIAAYGEEATSINKISFKAYKPIYGVGAGYRFTNRLSAQTGFYAGGKIYRAGPGDYKLRQGTYIREIIFIDAECYIYEVPVLIRYDLLAKRKYNVYASTGVSTFFFKKENYDFHFLNQTGAYRRMPYNYKKNADYFSVANFSLGFEYKILENLSVQAEPYTKIPLSGLGEGKVKLTSAGVFAGIRYQPFYKRSKK